MELDERVFNRILVISLGGIGDTIMATGLCLSLRQKFKDSYICGLTMYRSSSTILEHLGVFDKVIAHNFLNSSIKESLLQTWKLRRQKYDLSIVVFPANRGHYNILSRMIGAKYSVGHEYLVGNHFTYLRFLLTHRVNQTQRMHNVEENLKIAHLLGIPFAQPIISVGTLGESHKNWAEELLKGKETPFLGIHPGSSPIKNHTYRRWPKEKYSELAFSFEKQTGGTVLIFLGPDEIDMIDFFRSKPTKAIIVFNKTIEQVAALVKNCNLFVCNDSSLGHLATALKIPIVMILGPTNVSYIHPWGVPYRIVSMNLPCSPCFEISASPLKCRQKLDYACVQQVEVKSVLENCLVLLSITKKDSCNE